MVTAVVFVHFGQPGPAAATYKMAFARGTATTPLRIPGHTTLIPTPRPTPIVHVPTIYECQQPGDDQHKRLRICGEYFTPRDSIQLDFTIPSSHNPKTHKDIVVQDDGTFQDTLSILSCKSMPTAIRAYNQDNLSEVSGVFQDIQLNSCSSSAEVLKTEGDAKVSAFALLV